MSDAQLAVDDTGRRQRDRFLDARDLVAVEPDHQVAARDVARMPAPQAVHVVPAIRVEAVDHHRRAEQEPHLAARHADLDLVHLLDVEQVALLDVHSIDAAGEEHREEQGAARDGRAHNGSHQRRVLEDNAAHHSGIAAARGGSQSVETSDLRKAGLKVTLPRVKILEILAGTTDAICRRKTSTAP